MKSFYRKREKKGYTLAEVLITVAILIILMAIAVPAIFTIRRNLRQKALDNKAEIIYTAVQNNLTKLRSNGNSEKYAEDKASSLDATPLDMDEKKTLYYVTADSKDNDNSAASVLVTEDTIDADLYQHYWVVEYDPASASVYAVFYSETRSGYTTASYNNLRYKDNRLRDGAQVGYYGGDSVDSGSTSTLAPKITVRNEEKLQVTITSKRPDQNPLSYVVTLQDTLGHTLTLKYQPDMTGTKFGHDKDDLSLAATSQLYGNESGTIRGSVYTLTLTLDDLTEESTRFAALYGNKNDKIIDAAKQLVPGTDLTIKVTVKSKSSLVDGLSSEVKTNSLFGDDSTADQASIYYGRHLQNLDQNSAVTETITSAVQKSDIHFEEQADLDGDNNLSSWYSCYQNKAFHPITNAKLISYKKAEDTSEDSGSTQPAQISHLTTEESEKAGLFAETADNMNISDIRLSGARINGKSGTTYAGAFAAYADGKITLNNCQAYLDSADVTGKDATESWIQGADIQGGLIGSAAGSVTITNCLAATVMGAEDTSLTGGLIGEAQNGITVTQSYADSYLTGQVTGGLIGRSNGGTVQISHCYTAGYQKAVQVAAGLLAQKNSMATVDHSYTAVTWLKADTEGNTETVRYSTLPKGNDTVNNLFFLNGGTDYSEGTDDQEEKSWIGDKISYTDLSSRQQMTEKLQSTAFVSTASATYPYNLRQQGLTGYSYPALKGMPHYGDWEADFESGSLVYYEVYQETDSTESYGFHGGNVTPTLRDDVPVIGDGYGIVYEQASLPTDDFSVLYQKTGESGETSEETLTMKPKDSHYMVTYDDKTYYIYPLPAKVVNAAAVMDTWYQKITVQGANAVGRAAADETDDKATGSVFYYNPHFAKTEVSAAEAPETPTEVSVRTPRQLYALSKNYTEYAKITAKSTFMQELDLDYQTYDWKRFAGEADAVSVQIPIGEATPFVAKYDGKYHKIQGISFESAQTRVGFIAENQGTIRDLFLVSDYQANGTNQYLKYNGQIGNNQTVYMGALAAVNSGQILNCAVSGFYLGGDSHTVFVRQNGTLYFGGLTGTNQGTIRNSQVDTPLVNANILYGNAYIAGFAGENAGTIRNSYAIGKATVEYAKGAKAVLSGFTAKNLGQLTGDYCAVAMTAAGSTSTYGFAPKGGSINRNCRYLSGGTFRYLGNMEAYDNTSGAGTTATYEELKQENATVAECNSATGSGEGYPFTAVVTKADGSKVHFGNWQMASDLGSFGVVYWEREAGGSNDGYHFSYIGYTADAANPEDTLNRISGSTLCQQHDDGGIITEYGYGYYYSDNLEADQLQVTETDFTAGDENGKVSRELTKRLDGFHVIAYTTESSVGINETTSGSYMKMKQGVNSVNGVWTIRDTRTKVDYTFTINPFFGNAMQYGTKASGEVLAQQLTVLAEDGSTVTGTEQLAMPGETGKEYEIRSIDQLQYINWNSKTGNAVTTVGEKNYQDDYKTYTYLGQMAGDGTTTGTTGDGYWKWTGTDSPSLQQYQKNSDKKCQRGGYPEAYFDVTQNTEYWEFVKDDSDGNYSYEVPIWTVKDVWHGYQHRHYTYTTSDSQKGYWKWHGTGEPKRNATDEVNWVWVGSISELTDGKYNWIQSHDVDGDMEPEGEETFTQIGSLYDTKMTNEEADAYISYFTGTYDGNTYSIKNIEINSKNALVGLFGSIIGAKVQNVILYSEKENYIQRSDKAPKSWYAIGGMCGLAAIGQGYSAEETTIKNCTVSGYTIKDNSTSGAYGDGNVGGMFGMSTLDIQQCSAVNNIVLNTNFDTSKGDGVSVRTGGLVGSMRGKITKCYTGGEISCTTLCENNTQKWASSNYCSKIFLGGITGGIYIKNGGNLMKLLGGNIRGVDDNRDSNWNNTCTNPTQIITDCYTYIKMPGTSDAIWSHLMSLQPLGNNGETPNENVRNYHTGIQINNSYYYEGNIPAGSIRNFTAQNAGDGGGTITHINYDAASTGINWKQMADQEPVPNWGWTEGQTVSEDQKLSNIIGFDKVTTTENGNSVKGKYTFPGNRKDLEGENYPFPTILQQNTASGVANVHYGEWPLNGIYWEQSRANMDIFEDLVTDGGENDGQALKTFVLKDAAGNVGNDKQTADFTFSYSYGEDEIAQITSGTDGSTSTEGGTDSVETPDSTDSDGSTLLDDEDLIAKVEKIKYDSEVNGYVATVYALKTGTEIITATVTGASNQTYSASFTLTVTADLTVYASSSTVTQYAGENTELEVFAVPMLLYGVSSNEPVTEDTQSLDSNDVIVEDEQTQDESDEVVQDESDEVIQDGTEDSQENVTQPDEESSETTETVTELQEESESDTSEEIPENAAEETSENTEEGSESVSENIADTSEDTENTSEDTGVDMLQEESQEDSVEAEDTAGETVSAEDAVSEIAVQMLSDEEETEELISVYDEDTAAAPEKNLADRMTWKVEIDAEDEGLVDYTEVKDCKFTITSQAESDVTLTITGTYTYEGTDYTAVTWVEVITEADDTEDTSTADEESGSEGRSIVTEIPGSEDTVIMEDDGSGDVIIQEESEDLNDTVNSDNTENAAGTGEEILDENGYTEEVVTDDNSSDIVIEDNNEATVQENTEDSSVQDQEATEDVVVESITQDLEAEVGLESLTTDTESEE